MLVPHLLSEAENAAKYGSQPRLAAVPCYNSTKLLSPLEKTLTSAGGAVAGDGSLQKSFVWPPAPGRGEAACCHSTVTSDHHRAGDPAPGDQPGDGGDPDPLLLHLLLTFPHTGAM